MNKLTSKIPQEERKLISKLYWRSQVYAMLFTYSRWCGNSNAWVIWPYLDYLYPNEDDKEKKIEALKREQGIMNITPQMYPIMLALFCNMEKEVRDNQKFDPTAIDAIRASLQGPFCGVGDAIWWVTWRLVATGLGLPLALQGNVLGPIIFVLAYNIPSYIFRYYALYITYTAGASVISKAEESGLFGKLVRGSSIVGLVMIGYMIAMNVNVPLALSFTISGAEFKVLELVNQIVPGILSLGIVFLMMYLLKKNTKVMYMIFGLMVVCILFAFVGVF